jgi:sulfatase maturation enzyme AslB (radical SAM superfamily)
MADKPLINISINPTYYCNLSCSFCYLTKEQLKNRKLASIDDLEKRVIELKSHYSIGHVDVYGGEVFLLPEEYLYGLKNMLLRQGVDDIVFVTNLTTVPDIVHSPDITISVSYDFGARKKHDLVEQNMFLLSQRFTILSLASREFLDTVTVDEYVRFMNEIPHLKACEIKPYSTNQSNVQDVLFSEFEEFVWGVINHPEREFYFENKTLLVEAASGRRNAFSDDHIYITPDCRFAVLEFDLNDNEYFLNVDGVSGYIQWCKGEKERVRENKVCSKCPYFGSCLSEHLRDVIDTDNSCNGFKGLIDRWKNHESTASSTT